MRFIDRRDAGRQLATRLETYAARTDDIVVLGLPRGGVPVAREVAERLGAPLDAFLVRKLGVPGQEELAMGAIAEGDVEILSDDLVRQLRIPVHLVRQTAERARRELQRLSLALRGGRGLVPVQACLVILVDDGLATGSTMEAAVTALRRLGPAAIVVAVPVGAAETCDRLRHIADEVVCLRTPDPFQAVGIWYDDFAQTSDEEVRSILR